MKEILPHTMLLKTRCFFSRSILQKLSECRDGAFPSQRKPSEKRRKANGCVRTLHLPVHTSDPPNIRPICRPGATYVFLSQCK
jgi:hypothetical protein